MNNLGPAPVQTPYDQQGVFSFPWIRWFISVGQAVDNLLDSTGVKSPFSITGLPVYANNAAAISGGLKIGQLYRNGDVVQVVH